MVKMYDAVTPSNIPLDVPAVLAYVDGIWPWKPEDYARFPNAIVKKITVNGVNLVDFCDIENGDLTPQGAVNWVQRKRATGVEPDGVYCGESNWPTVRQAFIDAKVREPNYLVASYKNPPDPTIPAGAIGIQYVDTGGYDISEINFPTPKVVVMANLQMVTFSLDNTGKGDCILDGGAGGQKGATSISPALLFSNWNGAATPLGSDPQADGSYWPHSCAVQDRDNFVLVTGWGGQPNGTMTVFLGIK